MGKERKSAQMRRAQPSLLPIPAVSPLLWAGLLHCRLIYSMLHSRALVVKAPWFALVSPGLLSLLREALSSAKLRVLEALQLRLLRASINSCRIHRSTLSNFFASQRNLTSPEECYGSGQVNALSCFFAGPKNQTSEIVPKKLYSNH